MILRKKTNDPNTLLLIGMAALLMFNLARVAQRFLDPATDFWRGLADGMTWTVLGVAVACMLLSVRFGARQRAGRGEPPCG